MGEIWIGGDHARGCCCQFCEAKGQPMADKSVSETLDEFLDTVIGAEDDYRCRGCLYELARAVERRTAERCAEITKEWFKNVPSWTHTDDPSCYERTVAGVRNAIRREFNLEPSK